MRQSDIQKATLQLSFYMKEHTTALTTVLGSDKAPFYIPEIFHLDALCLPASPRNKADSISWLMTQAFYCH